MCRPVLDASAYADKILYFNTEISSNNDWIYRLKRVKIGIQILSIEYSMVLHPTFSTILLAHQICTFASSPKKVWFQGEYARSEQAVVANPARYYTDLVPEDTNTHELDKLISFLNAVNLNHIQSRTHIWPERIFHKAEEEWAEQFTAKIRIEYPRSTLLALCAGARYKQKDWGIDNFTSLLKKLAEDERSYVVLMLGAPAERESIKSLVFELQDVKGVKCMNVAGDFSLNRAVALIQQCDLCVGNDTFGLHAAISVGTPSVVIMGGGDFGRWTPWGDPEKHRLTYAPMECFNCRWECIYPSYRCIEDISVEMLTKEINKIIK